MRKRSPWMMILLATTGWGCWEANPNYKGARDMRGARDMGGEGDMAGCGRDPSGGGGGMGRPQVLVKGGTFNMQGKMVTLTDFQLDTYEVTVRAYRDCYANGAGPCSKPSTMYAGCNWTDAAMGKEDHPINCVTWSQAKAFCEWAKRRLPKEAEWEYAAGGVYPAKYPWGEEDPKKEDNPARLCWTYTTMNKATCPVGSHPKTILGGPTCSGVFDLAGNVWEWTASQYVDPYVADEATCSTTCSLRGGSWNEVDISFFQAAFRNDNSPALVNSLIGVRCANTL